jgi:hypothetical protein
VLLERGDAYKVIVDLLIATAIIVIDAISRRLVALSAEFTLNVYELSEAFSRSK